MPKKAKILFLDIETAPDLVWTWGVYEQNAISVKEHWYTLSFSAKWRGGKHITKGLLDYRNYNSSTPWHAERAMLKEIHELLGEADIVVAHNGIQFDMKKLNARFIDLGFKPPAPYYTVDTKKELCRVAKFSSNKLDWISKQLDIGSKITHEGWELWFEVMAGNKAAWKRMLRYNKHDVTLLEQLYERLSPWMRQPNANLFADDTVIRCTNLTCGSINLQSRGVRNNRTRSYQRYQCQDCGKWMRSTHMIRTNKAEVVEI